MAIKKLSAERLKYFEELIRRELTESMAYIEGINKDKA
jgi:hypothetical protein